MRKIFGQSLTYALLIIFGFAMVVPFIWMLSTSLMTQSEFNKNEAIFIPKEEYHVWNDAGKEHKVILVDTKGEQAIIHVLDEDGQISPDYQEYMGVPASEVELVSKRPSFHFENFVNAFKKVPFATYFANTLFVSILTLMGVLVTSVMAAYAFARLDFKGKDFIFYLFLSMMMVPQPIYVISSYIFLDKFNWLDTYQALIVPWIANIFTIFLFRQHFKSLPQELFDAASIDGCSTFGMLTRIVIPLSKGVIATASVFSLIGSWNSFMWPLVMTDRPELRVLQVGLSYFNQEASTQTTLLMAASTFSILPILLIFFLAQKQILASYAKAGLKD
ncbi:MAG: carbohydrate ABC transporter permease [Candidatus Cloacimonetes bacterium]|nr:carbohydrate ABC transporter permease [Candidatus Cloacimonadota bacterium]MDD4223067.1 carbohydrate ABC transporter permease [Candidatus Cloacimonadota bacterium]